MLSSEQKKILPYAIVILLGFIGFSLPLPLFPEMFLDPERSFLPSSYSVGEKTFFLGLLLACYPFGQLFGSPVLGRLSDHFGRKKTILISLSVCSLSYLFIAYSISLHSLVGLFVGLFIAGFAEGNVAIAQSVIADIASREQKAKHFGFIEIFASAGFIIGPIMGGLLADPQNVSWFTFSTPFIMAALITFFGILTIIFTSHETKLKKSETYPAFWESFGKLFSKPELRKYYIANFLIAMGYYSFFRFLPIYLERIFNFTTSQLAYVMAYDAFWIGVAILLIVPRAGKFLSSQKATAYSSLFYALFLILLLIPQNPWALMLTIPPLGLCFALSITYGSVLISDAADYHIHGQAMGCLQSIQVLAGVLTGILGGILAMDIPGLPLMVGAFMSGVCGLALFRK